MQSVKRNKGRKKTIQLAIALSLLAVTSVGVFAATSNGNSQKETAVPGERVEKSVNSPSFLLQGIESEKADVKWDIREFSVKKRDLDMKHMPCSQCHSEGQIPKSDGTEKRAHWDVQMNHADEKTMNCTTCHAVKDGKGVPSLESLQGHPISFNHSYQLCQQCHTSQAKDWAHGAHGKRVMTWEGPRIVENCTSCHNPHSPGMEKRWPKVIQTWPTTGR